MDKFQKIQQIIADELDASPEKIVREARLVEDLGADSLSVIELVMSFEDEFGIQIPDEELEKIKSEKNHFEKEAALNAKKLEESL